MDNNPNTDKKEEVVPVMHDSDKEIKGFNPVVFFKKDKNFVFVHQKLEKLGAAIYMITNLFDADEPLKWSLRNLSTDLLHINISLQSDVPKNTEEAERHMKEVILEIVSLLDIALFAGLVSSMNVSIMKREFQHVLQTIHKITQGKGRAGYDLGEDFFIAPVPENQTDEISHQIRYETRGIKDNSFVLKESFEPAQIHKTVSQDSLHEKSEKLRVFSPVAVKKNKRQSLIIALLKRKKEVMIKDVTEVIRDCSEKTIQRELLNLVEQGVLSKVGERRWTKYSLV